MVKEINVIEARDLIKTGQELQLIDVRSKKSFDESSLADFINIPLSSITKEISNLDGKKKTLIICDDGQDSRKAQKILEACHFNTQTIRGGLTDWKKIIIDY